MLSKCKVDWALLDQYWALWYAEDYATFISQYPAGAAS
jgi:hypothetical protein